MIGDGGEIERATQAQRAQRLASRVVRRQADRLAAREAIGVVRPGPHALRRRVQRVAGVDMEVAEERAAHRVDHGAGLAHLAALERGRGPRERGDEQ